MLAKTHVVKVLFLILGVVLGAVHSGCGTSSGKADAPAGNTTSTIRMTLSTTTGFTAIVADGRSTIPIRIQVTTGSGSPVAGTPVTFATDAGTLTEAVVVRAADATGRVASATARIESVSRVTVPTDTSGVAQVVLTSSLVTGPATVTADLVANGQNFRTNIVIQFVSGPPVRAELSASPPSVNATESSTLTVTVTDANSNPTPGHTVTFSLSTNTSGGTLDATSRVTDANGRATVTYTAGTTPGTDTAQAQVSSGVVGSTSLTVIGIPGSASRIDLLVSSPQLGSSGTGNVVLTALVRNAANNVISDVPVSFTADSGGIQVANATTSAAGTATALLTTGGDPTNRTIMVTATTGTHSAINRVDVTGTTLSLSGATALVLNNPTRLSILLRDSVGIGIANRSVMLQSSLGNPLAAALLGDPLQTAMCSSTSASSITVNTDSTGGAFVDVTACVAGIDIITALALGVAPAPEHQLSISADNFMFVMEEPRTLVPLGVSEPVTVEWTTGNPPSPQNGRTINFSATRGILSAMTAVTEAGEAGVTILSSQAGSAVITAHVTNGPSTQITIEFLATMPTSLILQARPTSLGVNSGGSTTQQSVITAIVQDINGNLVKNQTVNFRLRDTTGGSIFPGSALTDSFGRASTVYTSGAVPSAQNGVVINAEIFNATGMLVTERQVSLTVAQQALFVTLGTGNLIQTPSITQYAEPYSVLVTDVNGNPVANATVELTVFPRRYRKGFYDRILMDTTCTGSWFRVTSVTCNNEDSNLNGILDAMPVVVVDEDLNLNDRLDPGNVATTVPGRVVTDESGFAFFDVVYAREFATWVEVELQARATVAGSEGLSPAVFFLPILASDLANCNVAPPGSVSPYGIASMCDDPN